MSGNLQIVNTYNIGEHWTPERKTVSGMRPQTCFVWPRNSFFSWLTITKAELQDQELKIQALCCTRMMCMFGPGEGKLLPRNLESPEHMLMGFTADHLLTNTYVISFCCYLFRLPLLLPLFLNHNKTNNYLPISCFGGVWGKFKGDQINWSIMWWT